MAENPTPDLDNRTIAYGGGDDPNVTQAYRSGSTGTESQSADTPAPKTDKTETHDLGVGDSIELNAKTYQISQILVGDKVTGEAVIYKITDSGGDEFVLKLYYQFVNPQDEPRTEPLNRIKSFNHPNILKLHDFGTSANKYKGKFCFEISSFAEGGDLLTVADIKGKYTFEFLEDTLIPQLLAGLRTFHDAKIYHCDLKPQNVFYTDKAQTQIVLADYGSAKTRDEESEREIVKTSMVKGTDFYLAPEQARGVVSAKNDYYSLGMILLHLVYPEHISSANLDRIIERQYAGKKIIDYSSDPEYARLNLLIAGLTLQDIGDRWGQSEVDRWQKGEDVPVTYPSTRDTVPIKLGSITIRTIDELLDYIKQNDNWFAILIEDTEVYHMLLTWVTSVQDFQKKKIFDKMVQYYKEDGERYVGEAIRRYFKPQQTIQVGQQEFDLYGNVKFADLSREIYGALAGVLQTAEEDDLKFVFFQFEFGIGQILEAAEPNLRAQIRASFDKIAMLFGVDPKGDYSDHLAVLYTKFNRGNLAKLLHETNPDRKFVDIIGDEISTLEEVGLFFARDEERFKDPYLREELNSFASKQGKTGLTSKGYQSFLTTLFADKVKYDIEITNVQQVQASRGSLQVSYKVGKSLAAYFRELDIDKSFVEHGTRIERVVVKKSSKDFIEAVSAKHNIDADAIDDEVKKRLHDKLKQSKSSNGGGYYGESSNYLVALLVAFGRSLAFMLPLFVMLLIAEATFGEQAKILSILNTITPFELTLDVTFAAVKNLSLYGIHFLILLAFLPMLILNFAEKIDISPGLRGVYIYFGILLLLSPLISMLLTYLVIVSGGLWGKAISVQANPDLLAQVFYYTPWAILLIVSVISAFVIRHSFRFMPFLFALGVYFYASLVLHDYEVITIDKNSGAVTPKTKVTQDTK